MMRGNWGRTRTWLTGVLALMLGGCQLLGKKPPPPLETPSAQVTLGHYAGTSLSGPLARAIQDDAFKQTWTVQARVVAVEKLPADQFSPLATQARLIVAARGGAPTAPSARLTPGLVWRGVPVDFDLDQLLGDPLHRADLANLPGGIAPGTTADLRLAIDTRNLVIAKPIRRALNVRLSRGKESNVYELSVRSEELSPLSEVTEDLPLGALARPIPVQVEEETLIAPRQFDAERDRFLLAIPMTFPGSRATGVVIDLSINAAPVDDERLAAIERLKQDVAAAGESARQRIALSAGASEDLALGSALSALAQTGDDPRGALAYLANETGAELTENVVLTADAPLLQLLAKSVSERAGTLAKRDRANIAWLLDRTTVEVVGALSGDPAHPLSPAVYGSITNYAGEVGRQLDALKSLVGQSSGGQDLQNRLIAEHLLYLEDNSPSARVRAYDWLAQRSMAPPGYDPLAPARQRRTALEQANSTTQPGTRP